jgi:hypothetical protein
MTQFSEALIRIQKFMTLPPSIGQPTQWRPRLQLSRAERWRAGLLGVIALGAAAALGAITVGVLKLPAVSALALLPALVTRLGALIVGLVVLAAAGRWCYMAETGRRGGPWRRAAAALAEAATHVGS